MLFYKNIQIFQSEKLRQFSYKIEIKQVKSGNLSAAAFISKELLLLAYYYFLCIGKGFYKIAKDMPFVKLMIMS